MARRIGNASAVVVAIALQIVILKLQGIVPTILAVPASLFAACLTRRVRIGELFSAMRGLAIMLGAVLVVRVLADPAFDTVAAWSEYAARIMAAVIVAFTALRLIGTAGVQDGLMLLLSPLPRLLRRPLLDVTTAALYVIPAVGRHLGGSRRAARIRLIRGGRGPVRRTAMIARAGFISVAALPPRRAEAMVVREILKREMERR